MSRDENFAERIKKAAPRVNDMWARRYPKGRPPERMAQVLLVLKSAWESNPQLRLGQLILNATGHVDIYNIEDDEMLRLLSSYYVPASDSVPPSQPQGGNE